MCDQAIVIVIIIMNLVSVDGHPLTRSDREV